MIFLKRTIVLICLALLFLLERALFNSPSERNDLTIGSFIHLPQSLSKILVLEFPSIVSNYLFLNTLTYMGEKVLYQQQTSTAEWKNIYKSLDLITFLDPMGTDPYVLAETTLPWDAGMVAETNKILLRAAKHRPTDYRPNFFLWFNHYYFFKDPKTAAPYLEKAAKYPGSPKYFSTLAARMQLYAGQHRAAIHFLQTMLKETYDPQRREMIKIRLNALNKLAYLEQAIQKYKTKYKKPPKDLSQLVTANIIKVIPVDPYGGDFYIMENGRVYTTSKLVLFQQGKKTPSNIKTPFK